MVTRAGTKEENILPPMSTPANEKLDSTQARATFELSLQYIKWIHRPNNKRISSSYTDKLIILSLANVHAWDNKRAVNQILTDVTIVHHMYK